MKQLTLKTIILAFSILFMSSIASAIEITEDEIIDNFEIHYFYDTSNIMSIDDVSNEKHFKQINNNFNLGFSKDTVWFKLILHNSTSTEQARTITTVDYTNSVFNFYELSANNTLLSSSTSGQNTPIDQRAIQDPFPAYQITINPNQTRILYIKLRSDFSISNVFTIHKQKHYEQSRNLRNYFFIFFFGVVFAIFIYNTIIYIYNSEQIYIYYLFYISFHAIWIFFHSGFSAYIVPHQAFNYSFLVIPITFLLFIFFTQELLKDSIKTPYFDTIIAIYKFLFMFNAIYMFIDFSHALVLSSILINTLFFLGIFIVKYGNKSTRLYAFALMLYLVFLTFPTLVLFDLMANNFFTRTANGIGSIIEMILFSVVIANRIQTLKQENINANESLMEYQSQQNQLLQVKVDEQTKSLKLLFQELHHRVKNNFQFILTFLWIQKKSIKDKDAVEALELTTKRIYSISLLHELLYKKGDTFINFKEYLEEFLFSIRSENNNVSIESNIEEVKLSFDDAVTFGLISNELITNSLKYAFDEIKNPKITIDFYSENDLYTFSFKDNGIGFDKELLKSKSGLGHELIQEFVQKLNKGTMNLNTDNGVSITITFSKTIHEQ